MGHRINARPVEDPGVAGMVQNPDLMAGGVLQDHAPDNRAVGKMQYILMFLGENRQGTKNQKERQGMGRSGVSSSGFSVGFLYGRFPWRKRCVEKKSFPDASIRHMPSHLLINQNH